MKANSYILLSFFVTILLVTSCRETNEYVVFPSQEEDVRYTTVPFSITVGITPMTDGFEDIKLKTTFYKDDIIEISNSEILAETAILKSDDCKDKDKALFSGKLKVKLGKSLIPGSTTFTAALKNADDTLHLYNDGKPYKNIVQVYDTMDVNLNSYWACENFTYNGDATAIDLEQKTVFVKFDVPFGGVTFTMSLNNAFSREVDIFNDVLYAVPYGMVLKSEKLDLEKKLDEEEKCFYTIKAAAYKNCIPGVFSVADNKKVNFSKGNLDWSYNEDYSEKILQFAQHQYDDGSDLYFGTWLTEPDNLRNDSEYNLIGNCVLGTEWSLLSDKEWYYLLYERPDAEMKRRIVYIKGEDRRIEGLMLLPDDWTMYDEYLASDEYTEEEWSKMEEKGAVFLTCGSWYNGYWTSSFVNTGVYDEVQASSLIFFRSSFYPNEIMTIYYSRQDYSPEFVRLVYAWNTGNNIHPTPNIDRCIEVATEAHDVSHFLITTPKYYKGDRYEISMSVMSNEKTSICATTYGEDSDQSIFCGSVSNLSWTPITEKGMFVSDGEGITFSLGQWFPCRYYFDNISIKINGKEVVFNGDCSTNYISSFFDDEEICKFVDKTYINMEPSKIEPETIVLETNEESWQTFEKNFSLNFVDGNYSIILEIKGDQPGSLGIYLYPMYPYDIKIPHIDSIDFNTEWETKEIFFSIQDITRGFIQFSSQYSAYIRNMRIVYHGR